MWWWRKKDPEPEPEWFPETPYAALVADLIEMDLAADQVVHVVHLIEEVTRQAELRVRAQMNLSAAKSTRRRADRADKGGGHGADRKRQKWRRQKKHQRERRARLRLVHPSDEAA